MSRTNVRGVAAGRWRDILLSLGVDERTLNGKHCPCPMCGGKDRFRFDDKEGRGTYFCSGCGAGDGVQLAMGITGLPFKEAAREIERLAGSAQVVDRHKKLSNGERIAVLARVWSESVPLQLGDEAFQYLTGRGLRLQTAPSNLRLHPSLPYRDDCKVLKFAAMVARVTGPDGSGVSLHRTYLQGSMKAPVAQPKKLMPGLPLVGAAIRLTPVADRLGIAEGIETALAASELFGMPVWSCIHAQGVESFLPPVGVKEIVIYADNDPNFTGQSAAYRSANRLKLMGYEVTVCVPPNDGDWLDQLKLRKALR